MTRNTDDQPREPASSPRDTTPVAPPSVEAAPQMLMARARCPGEGQDEQGHRGRTECGGADALDDAASQEQPLVWAAAATRVPG